MIFKTARYPILRKFQAPTKTARDLTLLGILESSRFGKFIFVIIDVIIMLYIF